MSDAATLTTKLAKVQQELRAPKNQHNAFAKFNYRSCEDILEAVKPLLHEQGLVLTISDELCNIGERYYVRATATISDGGGLAITTTAYAREEAEKKGMDASQITGSTSSYARKYCLNGLFLIDDNKDSDTNEHAQITGRRQEAPAAPPRPQPQVVESPDPMASDEQVNLIRGLWKQSGRTVIGEDGKEHHDANALTDALWEKFHVGHPGNLTKRQATQVIDGLKKKIAQQENARV